MIKSPTLHDTESFDTSLPAVVRKFNMPHCVGDDIRVCVTWLLFYKAESRDLCRRIYKYEGLLMAVCSEVALAGRENQFCTRVVRTGLTCPTLPLLALLMALTACLCANVEIREAVTGGF